MSNNRLIRDTDNAMLGGVCAGIANRLEADVTIVRIIAFGIIAVTAGIGAVAYIGLWLLMPAPNAAPGIPSKEALTEEVRDAGERVKAAAAIIGNAAKQAASEINSEVAGKRAPGAAAPTTDAASEANTQATTEGGSTAAAENMTPPSDPTAPNATTADPPTGDESRPQQS